MRISLNWIKRILATDNLGRTAAELQALLSQHVCEIDAVESVGPRLDGVVVGLVLTCAQHPNADRLRVTTVDIGAAAPVPVVCGAPNVAAGQLVAVATVGTQLTMPGKDGAPTTITIKPAKLRGEPSQGMICAEDELGLGTAHDGIMVLAGDLRPGTPLAQVLGGGDQVLVVENSSISHRPDLWSQLGWAREVAAVLGRPAPATPDTAWSDLPGPWRAEIRDAGCLSYCGAIVEGVGNQESPAWLKRLLESCGVRPLGLLVDITNLVMLELGEPMHAFDLRDFSHQALAVRAGADGETLTTLDGKAHRLAAGDLVIADGVTGAGLALAGIMGGAAGMVRPDTSAVLLEAAIFHPGRIRRTRTRLGIATDSSARFEKGLPVELAPAAINRAIALLAELAPGCRVAARFHAGDTAGEARAIPFDLAEVARTTGLDAEPAAHRAALERLGFHCEGASPQLSVQVPWWRRRDVSITADLVEEAGRLHGWNRLPAEVARLPAAAPAANPLHAAAHRARRTLSAHGWDEVCTYVFANEAWAAALAWDAARQIRLGHAAQGEGLLRQSLLPGLAEAVGRNRKALPEVALYEVGSRYAVGCGHGDCADEEVAVAGCCAGQGDETPFYAARDAGLALIRGLGREAGCRPASQAPAGLLATRCVELTADGQPVGFAGELARPVRELAGCPERVGHFCVRLGHLVRSLGEAKPVRHRMPSRFPAVTNDFTWECDESTAFAALADATAKAAGPLCAGVALTSTYRGAPYAAGRKAVCLTLTLQSDERTLEDKDIHAVRERVTGAVAKATGAVLRG